MQHCNDEILKAMNRRETKASLTELIAALRARIPGLVLRTSLIAGLPGEDEAAFEELCTFLREMKIERAGVFTFSPEDGTRAATDGPRGYGGPPPDRAGSGCAVGGHRRV